MPNVCALVVTYNRPELLIECLKAIVNQSTIVSELIIIDNFSSEETLGILLEHNFIPQYSHNDISKGGLLQYNYKINNSIIKIHFQRLSKNTGGAGGFNIGMRYFYEKTNCEYLWLMDDDCLPIASALEKIVDANLFLHQLEINIGFIASRTLCDDGLMCRMTQPVTKLIDALSVYDKRFPCIEIENASFVSLFIPRIIIKECGLPFKEYFIWCDDLEYTTRITKKYHSYIALESVVIHKTANNISSSDEISEDNFFKHKFGIRNKISWILCFKGTLHFIFLSYKTFGQIIRADLTLFKKFILLKSLINGWFFKPEIEYLHD